MKIERTKDKAIAVTMNRSEAIDLVSSQWAYYWALKDQLRLSKELNHSVQVEILRDKIDNTVKAIKVIDGLIDALNK